jgi:hypothetical protein
MMRRIFWHVRQKNSSTRARSFEREVADVEQHHGFVAHCRASW